MLFVSIHEAGVGAAAGLQAIATAKRMGAIVSATYVPPVAREQIESLGGKFVMVESDENEDAETAGGYAKHRLIWFQDHNEFSRGDSSEAVVLHQAWANRVECY